MGGTLGKILSGGSFEARFDSSNSFVTYNGKLFERQKLEINSRIEVLSYSGNHKRMLELEEEVWEIEDTIRKLMP